ncbi:MAG: thymidylate kinase [Bryobacteraceae bacterium]|jgi:dTMP kinase
MVPNRYRGKLIVVEGIRGSGKRTQGALLNQWLRAQGYATAFGDWNSSPLVRDVLKRGQTNRSFTQTTFSLIQAADFADRMESYILPLIKAGAVVFADGYVFTAFAREAARGANRTWLRNLYSYALRPSLTFYFRVPVEEAINRVHGESIEYYDAGMDLGLSPHIQESFRIFQQRILDEYEDMAGEMEFRTIDATLPVEEQQRQMRQIVTESLSEVLRRGILRTSSRGSNGIAKAVTAL